MLTLTPAFSFVQSLQPSLPAQFTAALHPLSGAAKGDPLGVVLGHGIGPQYSGGSVSEYFCTVVAKGDGRSCDGAAFVLTPAACVAVRALEMGWLRSHRPARNYQAQFRVAADEFETMHFKTFSVAVAFAPVSSSGERPILGIHVLIHAAQTTAMVETVLVELKALFAFLCEINSQYAPYRIEIPAPQDLQRSIPVGA